MVSFVLLCFRHMCALYEFDTMEAVFQKIGGEILENGTIVE